MAHSSAGHQFVIQISPRSIVISIAEPMSLLHRVEVELPREKNEWIGKISELAEEIQPLVQHAVTKGSRALILYQSPTLVSQVSCLNIANRIQAQRAACLACAVTTHSGPRQTIERAAVVGTDELDGETRSHVVAAADHTDVAEAVAEFAMHLGFEVEAIVPREMYTTANIMRWALEAESEMYGILHIGRTFSCLAVSQNGVLRLFRQVGFVTQQLVDALVLPIVINAETGQTVVLEHEEAEALICKWGIPDRDDVVDEERGLRGFHILSAIQSHLQRAAVEIKQSIRFGLPEEVRASLSLRINGAGSSLPNLQKSLSELLDIPLTEDHEHGCMGISSHSPIDELRCTLLKEQGSSSEQDEQFAASIQLNMLPPSIRRRRFESRFRKGLWVGLAAGLLIVFGDAMMLRHRAAETTETLNALRADKEQLVVASSQRNQVIELNGAMKKIESEIAEYGRDATIWSSVLEELSSASDKDIRLSNISASTNIEGDHIRPQMQLEGYAFGANNGGQIRRYVNRLRRSPMFKKVVMGDVSPGELEGRTMRTFHLDIELTAFDTDTIDTTVSLSSVEDDQMGGENH